MTYGIFNLASGNLIDSVDTEPAALEMLSSLLEERDADPEMIGLIVEDDLGHRVAALHGGTLQDAVFGGHLPNAAYA
jgi:hypothetical protein